MPEPENSSHRDADHHRLDAVAELVDFALRLGAGDLAPSMLHEHARPPERA